MFDIIIKNANIIDGTGKDAYLSDIAIKDGKIAKIGIGLEGGKIIDATGLTLTPGFIDSHSHSDNSLFEYPNLTEKIEQGVTFSIGGMCGGSATPVVVNGSLESTEEFFKKFETVDFGSGTALVIGHNTIRRAIMGNENRLATPEELEKMKELLRASLRAGAIGMSFGLFYVPGCYSDINECIELAKVVHEEGGLLTSHIRNESCNLLESVEEYLEIIKASGCRAVFSHHKSAEKENWGKVHESLAMIDKANDEGCDIYLDVYPYTASSTTLLARFVPKKYHPEGTTSAVELLKDPETRKIIYDGEKAKWGNDLSWTLVTGYPGHPEYEGLNVNEIADREGVSDRVEMALRIITDTNGGAQGCFFTMCEEDVECVLSHPRAMICTDSSVGRGRRHYHPRLRSSFIRALAHYTRDRKVVSLPEMIRRMTSLPAHVYGLETKGVIREGMDADVCLFDYEKLRDAADYKNPTLRNEGLSYVIVNGQIAVFDGKHNHVKQAKLYRKK